MSNFQSIAGSILWAGVAALLFGLACTPMQVDPQPSVHSISSQA